MWVLLTQQEFLLYFFRSYFGVVFGITKNIFSLIPIAWSVTSGMGSMMGGFIGGWDHVLTYAVVVAVQIFILWKVNSSSRSVST